MRNRASLSHREAHEDILRTRSGRRVVHVDPAVPAKLGSAASPSRPSSAWPRVGVLVLTGIVAMRRTLRRWACTVDVAVRSMKSTRSSGSTASSISSSELFREHDAREAILFGPRAMNPPSRFRSP